MSSFAIHLLDVGQGEAVLMDFPDGSFGLIDGGPRKDAKGVIEHIESRILAGKTFRLAGVSQWDADHIRGMPAILNRFRPQEFRYPGVDLQLLEEVTRHIDGADAAAVSSQVRNAIAALPAESVAHFTAPDPIPGIPDVELHVLSPMPRTTEAIRGALAASSSLPSILRRSRNRTSVALWIRAWKRVVFLAGELEEDQYRAIDAYFRRAHGALVPYNKNHLADWIKLSHHGSDTNNPQELFKLFAARDFVASASSGGSYDHPHPNALKRVHFDHGGRMLCTNLGKGCHRIITARPKVDASSPEAWANNLSAASNPQTPCYRTVTVTITSSGHCRTTTAHNQPKCPYGGAKNGQFRW